MIIAGGREAGTLHRILNGDPLGTYFHPRQKYLSRRKRWIAYGRVIQGSIIIDDGAREALCGAGKSLLPVGVLEVEGSFKKDALVAVCDRQGREIGRGLSNFSSDELLLIKKQSSSDIVRLIGREAGDEVIHRDKLVIHHSS